MITRKGLTEPGKKQAQKNTLTVLHEHWCINTRSQDGHSTRFGWIPVYVRASGVIINNALSHSQNYLGLDGKLHGHPRQLGPGLFYLPMSPWHTKQCLAHIKYLIKMCQMNECVSRD